MILKDAGVDIQSREMVEEEREPDNYLYWCARCCCTAHCQFNEEDHGSRSVLWTVSTVYCSEQMSTLTTNLHFAGASLDCTQFAGWQLLNPMVMCPQSGNGGHGLWGLISTGDKFYLRINSTFKFHTFQDWFLSAKTVKFGLLKKISMKISAQKLTNTAKTHK